MSYEITAIRPEINPSRRAAVWTQWVDLHPARTWRQIATDVAALHGLTLEEVLQTTRVHRIAHARQHIMWALYRQRRRNWSRVRSKSAIGRLLGLDHSTVVHGIRQHEKRAAR